MLKVTIVWGPDYALVWSPDNLCVTPKGPHRHEKNYVLKIELVYGSAASNRDVRPKLKNTHLNAGCI